MKFVIVFALLFAVVSARDLYSRSIEVPVLESEGRIVHGITATGGQFKYQAGIAFRKGITNNWCSGSLIRPDWILSAGHCTIGATSALVYLGSPIRLCGDKEHIVLQKDIFTHPTYSGVFSRNDISLIRIPTINETSRIGVVKIPSKNEHKNYLNESVVVAGWGRAELNGTAYSNTLQYAVLKVATDQACLDQYALYYIDIQCICVASQQRTSPCHGDSGGALVLEGQNLQIGVLAYGNTDHCDKGYPTVFTRVSFYLDWILSHTEKANNTSKY